MPHRVLGNILAWTVLNYLFNFPCYQETQYLYFMSKFSSSKKYLLHTFNFCIFIAGDETELRRTK